MSRDMKQLLSTKAVHKAKASQEALMFSASIEAIRERAKTDLNFYAGLLVPHLMRTPFPKFYCDLFLMLTSEGTDPEAIVRFALGLPRGFVKTTFLKILMCHCIHYGRNSFFLVVASTQTKATNFCADVDAMLEQPTVSEIYGNWAQSKYKDNAEVKLGFMDGRMIILLPCGAGSSVRGANIDNKRPDMIICDDVQSREQALSPVQSHAMLEWFTGTLIKCIESWGSNRLIVFLGNMYPGDSLLQKLRGNPEWISLITGAILEDGESLWPELKSVRALLAEYRHDAAMGLGHIWFAEVQNDPLDERYRLLASPIPDCPVAIELLEPDAVFITVDPAGFRKSSDDNVYAVHKLYDGVPVLTDLEGGVWNPYDTVKNVIVAAVAHGACLIGIESTGYQQSLCYWMDFFIQRLGLQHIQVVELKTFNATKLSRIRDYIAEVLSDSSHMSREARTKFSYYAHLYKLGKSDNRDDYLDAPAYQKQILTLHNHLLISVDARQHSLANLPEVVDVDLTL